MGREDLIGEMRATFYRAQSWQVHPPLKFFSKLLQVQHEQDTEKHRPIHKRKHCFTDSNMIVCLPPLFDGKEILANVTFSTREDKPGSGEIISTAAPSPFAKQRLLRSVQSSKPLWQRESL